MTRSKWKGPFVSKKLLDQLKLQTPKNFKEIFTFERSTVIVPKLLGLTINVHNGKNFTKLHIKEAMLGKKLVNSPPLEKNLLLKKKNKRAKKKILQL